jgi:hypothetical protein
MANYTSHNLGVLQRRMGSRLGNTGSVVAVEIFTEVAKSVFAFIDSQQYYKNDTFNLRDSVGVGIYDGGTLVKWIDNPMPKATGSTTYTYHGVKYTISGRDKLERAINNAHRATIGQYSMIIFCAAPYGYFVEKSLGDGGDNKRGKGWWSEGLIPHAKATFVAQCNKHKIPVRYGRT